jgi:hypothetical protein
LININLLPKALKRIREPGYWRVLAVAFPLLVGGVIVGIQVLTNQTITNLERDVQVREDQLALLQPFLAEQRDLQQRQQALRQLISIAEEVRRGRVVWTAEIGNLLELLPPALDADTPSIDFRTSTCARSTRPRAARSASRALSIDHRDVDLGHASTGPRRSRASCAPRERAGLRRPVPERQPRRRERPLHVQPHRRRVHGWGCAAMNFNLRNLRQRDIAIILVVLTVIGGVLWYFYMYQPSQDRIAELEADIVRLETEIRRGEDARRNLPDLRLAVACSRRSGACSCRSCRPSPRSPR